MHYYFLFLLKLLGKQYQIFQNVHAKAIYSSVEQPSWNAKIFCGSRICFLITERNGKGSCRAKRVKLRSMPCFQAPVRYHRNQVDPIASLFFYFFEPLFLYSLINWMPIGGLIGPTTPFLERRGANRLCADHRGNASLSLTFPGSSMMFGHHFPQPDPFPFPAVPWPSPFLLRTVVQHPTQ